MTRYTSIWYIVASNEIGAWSHSTLSNLADTLTSNGAIVIQTCFSDVLPMNMKLPIRRNIDNTFDEIARHAAGFLTFGDIKSDAYNTPRIDLLHPDNVEPLNVLNAVVKQLERAIPSINVVTPVKNELPKINNTIFTITQPSVLKLIEHNKLFEVFPKL